MIVGNQNRIEIEIRLIAQSYKVVQISLGNHC